MRDAVGDSHPWHPYHATVCEFPAADGLPALAIDFREPVSRVARAALLARLGGPFSIVTAHNPTFLDAGHASDVDNRRAHERLVARARTLGVRSVEATGAASDDGHRERGLALAIVGAQARALAIEFGQDAYFEFDGERFAIAPACREGAGRTLLP